MSLLGNRIRSPLCIDIPLINDVTMYVAFTTGAVASGKLGNEEIDLQFEVFILWKLKYRLVAYFTATGLCVAKLEFRVS